MHFKQNQSWVWRQERWKYVLILKSTVGTNMNGTETQTPESVGTPEPGSKPSMATGSQPRLLGIFVLASLGCSWEAFLSWYTKIQIFCLFLLDFWMARSDLIFFYFCLVRVAQIVGSWDPNAEKVETERGNGGKILPIRAKNGVIALNEIKKNGPNINAIQ